MGNAFLYGLPAGVAGDVTRKGQSTIEAQMQDQARKFTEFGLPGKMLDGKFVPVSGGESESDIYGFAVRPYPTQQNTVNASFGSGAPANGFVCDVMRRGYMTVICRSGVATTGGKVYVRIAAASGLKPLGGIEAVADGANTIELTKARFMVGADANGLVEIQYNI